MAQPEQIFRGVVVVTSRPARRRHIEVKGTPFVLKTVKSDRLFGTTALWREQTKVQVSDPSRTLVDLLNYPDLGGGARHVAQVLREYVEGPHKDVAKLLEYIKRLDNRTICKRLGYLLEVLEIPQPELLEVCRDNLSAGYSLFDPTAKRGRSFNRRWGLQVNVNIKRGVSKQ